ncbi:D-glycero-beta-D-manno-heptose-7-phosphate kinase [bacterium]|nr:D-glycero-beta-D-manno-heptose-7-phosphate kinase [bacterium]
MDKVSQQRIKKIVGEFKNKRVLVLGDLMLDKYVWGRVGRISPEAPVPVVEVKKDTSCLGGSGNVGHNLESLGATPLLVGVVGQDQEGDWVKSRVTNGQGIITDSKRPTIVKTRIIAHHQQVVRVDIENKKPVSHRMEEQIFRYIQDETFHALLISDYNKGLLTRSLMKKVLPYAQENKIPVFVDPKVENFSLFSPVTLITPNHVEAERIVHHRCGTNQQTEKAGEKILERTQSRYLIIKRGEQGMSVFEKGKKAFHIPTLAKEVYDVTGAGDTVIAVASLALVSGATIHEAAILANTAAGLVVGKIGTASLTPQELLSHI